ncbi:MAG: hypothetical protein ACRDSH_03230, partial [Pseudonocardiaceae bacterium]
RTTKHLLAVVIGQSVGHRKAIIMAHDGGDAVNGTLKTAPEAVYSTPAAYRSTGGGGVERTLHRAF